MTSREMIRVGIVDSMSYMPTRAYRVCWPYVCYSGYGGYLWLYNCYEKDFICRIEPPLIENVSKKHDLMKIVNTFITSDKNVFMLLDSRETQ